jgi:hypothetical protein
MSISPGYTTILWLPTAQANHQESSQRQLQPVHNVHYVSNDWASISFDSQLAAHGKSHALRVMASEDIAKVARLPVNYKLDLIELTAPR